MSLRFIFGRAGSGKSYFCLNDIKSRLNDEQDAPLILLVPEQFSLQAEQNLVKTVGIGGIIKAEVLSFRRMAYRVFNEVGGLTRKHINSAGKCMLIYRIIESRKEQLNIFSRASGHRGFINVLSETIAEFKKYSVTPETLKKAADSLTEDDVLKSKLLELYTIYEQYEKILHKKYMDSDDDLSSLSKKLEQSSLFDGAEIWVDEFSGFTPQEYAVIEKLLIKAKRVNVSLCTDCLIDENMDECEIFAPAKNTVKKLIRLAEDNNIEVEKPVAAGGNSERIARFKDSEELLHLERQFFSFPYKHYPGNTQDISIFSAADIYTEVENTARDIIRLCRDEGLRYKDISVVSGNLDAYEKLIRVIFTEHGIPFFVDRKKSINNHPLILLVLSVLEIFLKNWSYEAVFRYLKTGLSNIERESIDILENYVLACGIRGNTWIQDKDWFYRPGSNINQLEITDYEQSIIERVNEARLRLIEPLMNFRSKTKGRKKAREICTALYEFLCEIEVPEKIEERVQVFKQSGELELANEYSQVWNIVMEVFDQIVEALGDESLGLDRFGKILAIGLGEYKIGLIPPALDQVMVGSIERSKSHEVRALYLLGVNDGVFPSTSNPEGILTDKNRKFLYSKGLELAKDSRSMAFEEQYLIYTALTTAGNYLRLSFPIADNEGKTMRPSIVISRIKKIFPDISEHSNIIKAKSDEENIEMVSVPYPTFNELVASLRGRAEGYEINPLWQDVYRWYMENEKWKDKCSMIAAAFSYSNQVSTISPGKAGKLYGDPLRTSVSRIESYVSCPFSFFIQYGLGAKERKVYGITAPDIGTFMHNVIDRFSKKLDENGIDWRDVQKEWCCDEVSNIVDDMLKNLSGTMPSSSERYKYLAGRLKRVLSRAVCLIAEHISRSGFNPLDYEVAFGDGGKYPPIIIELPSGEKIHLTGRIDRIDIMETKEGTYLRVIDYKSGSKSFKLSDVYHGLQVQLIAYLNAILKLVGKELPNAPVIPAGILYFKIDDPIIRVGDGDGINEQEIEKEIMKRLKMRGLLLADADLIKEMDRQIDGDSLIIPARINKNGELGRSSAATEEQFEILQKHVENLLVKLGTEIIRGNIAIRPYKKNKEASCTYCRYSAVCHFDPQLKDNRHRVLNDMNDEQAWEMLKAGAIL
jgi:ATP-dependent helicase/nuclease subunit B